MSEANIYWLILGILSVWRVTHLLHAEDGPWDIVVRLRRLAGAGVIGTMLDCFACLSLWVSIAPAIYLARTWEHGIMLWLALSAGAMLLQRVTEREPGSPPAFFIEDKEE
jgi:hypothetical protein